MIHYNMRYKGPYEYEKFILNILQYSNNSCDFIDELVENNSFKTLKEFINNVDELYTLSTGPKGNSEKCYKKLIMFKEMK